MSGELNISSEVINKIVDSIVNTVPTKIIYIFREHANSEETNNSNINIYVVTANDDNNKMDFEAAENVGVSLFWLDKPLNIFCLSEKEFEGRAQRPIGLEKKVAAEGVKIYG